MSTFTVPDSIPTIPVGTEPANATDVTQQLLDWIATVPNGRGDEASELVIPGLYRVDGGLRLIGRSRLAFTFTNGGGFVRTQPVQSAQFTFTHCSYISLSLPKIVGCKDTADGYVAANENQHGFLFESSQYINVIGPTSQHVWGDHFHFGHHAGDSAPSHDITVIGGICGSSGRDPISASGAHHITVRGTKFAKCRTCIDLEPNGHYGDVTDITVDSCEFTQPALNWFASMSPSDVGNVQRITLTSNHVTNGAVTVVVAGGATRSDFTVMNNTGNVGVGNPKGAVMWFSGVDGQLVVTGNQNGMQSGRTPPMRMARWDDYTHLYATITYSGNTHDLG